MRLFKKIARNQRGMASFLATGVLASLLMLVVVTYSVTANRENQKAVQNQIGQSAYYAAESGINQAFSYTKTWLQAHPGSSLNVSNCTQLLNGGNPAIPPSVSSDGTTKYTCILVSTDLSDLEFSSIDAYKSEVIKLSPSANMTKMLLSWQTTGNSNYNGVDPTSGTPLHDETTWAKNGYEPLLRVSIYPIRGNSLNLANANYFFYPTAGAANSNVPTIHFGSANSNTIQQGSCYHGSDKQASAGSFGTITDYDCNIIIDNLPDIHTGNDFGTYYLQITPLYSASSLRIEGQSGTTPVTFSNNQAQIDVTAQSNAALKRLYARVDLSNNISADSNGVPVNALQSPFAICKRIQVPSDGSNASIDSASSANCQDQSGL